MRDKHRKSDTEVYADVLEKIHNDICEVKLLHAIFGELEEKLDELLYKQRWLELRYLKVRSEEIEEDDAEN